MQVEYSALQKSAVWRRFSGNFFSFGYNQAITLAAQFLTVPFFLSHWGASGYADWLVLAGIPITLNVLDLGVAQASSSRASLAAARGDVDAVRASLQTSFLFSITVAILATLLGVSFGGLINWSSIVKLETIDYKKSTLIFQLLSVYVSINLLSSPLNSWFIAAGRSSLGFFVVANKRVIDIALTMIVLHVGGGPVVLASVMLAGQIAFIVAATLIATKVSPWRALGISLASKYEFKQIFRPSLANVSITISQVILLQGSVQMLNQISTPVAVIAFTTARTLMRLILQVGNVINVALRPELSRLIGKGDNKAAISFTKSISKLTFTVATAGYIAIILFGPLIIRSWTLGAISVKRIDLALIGLHAIISVAWYVPASYFISKNSHVRISFWYLASSIFAMALWYLSKSLYAPVYGASAALALPELITLVATFLAVKNLYRSDTLTAKSI